MKGVFITILILAIIAVGAYYFWDGRSDGLNDNVFQNGEENGVYCTMDAKLCSDGSYVGRVPPSCEFAACPASTSTDDSSGMDVSGSLDARVGY